MLLKISIIVIYCVALFRFFIKWKKCNFILQGNMILLLQCAVPLSLILPGNLETVLQRLLLYSSLFGISTFWYMLFPKMIENYMKWVACAFLLLILSGKVLLLSCMLLLAFSCAPCLVRNEEERLQRGGLNLGKVQDAVMEGALPLFAGVAGLAVYHLLGRNCYAGWTVVALVSAVPLVHIYRYRPACWNYDALARIRRKAYLLGRNVDKEGQLLEDDGGIINECMVDDARILYNIMKLFEEEKLYRSYELKIGDIAKQIGTNKTYLSRVLNTRVSKNFCQFVNYYRIKEICAEYLKDPKKEIRYLSEQYGFSSQSNFSIVFKYNTGYTPGDWCRLVKSKLEKNEAVYVDDYLL